MKSSPVISAYAEKFLSLTPQEATQLDASFTPAAIKKRQFIVQPNFVATHRYFVVQGAFRGYVVNAEGQEHTIQLAIDEWWISDYNSYIYQQPGRLFVVALEDSIVLRISFEEEQRLKAASHTMETFFRIMAERSAAFLQRRLITSLTQTAAERYASLVENYPLLVQRVPQYALASYLGMTTEFLSKIRHQRVKQRVEPVQANFLT